MAEHARHVDLAVNRVFIDFAMNLNVEGLTGWQLDVAQADTARLTAVTTEAVAVVEALIGFLGLVLGFFLRSANRCGIGREQTGEQHGAHQEQQDPTPTALQVQPPKTVASG